jgi:hypothetical protein
MSPSNLIRSTLANVSSRRVRYLLIIRRSVSHCQRRRPISSSPSLPRLGPNPSFGPCPHPVLVVRAAKDTGHSEHAQVLLVNMCAGEHQLLHMNDFAIRGWGYETCWCCTNTFQSRLCRRNWQIFVLPVTSCSAILRFCTVSRNTISSVGRRNHHVHGINQPRQWHLWQLHSTDDFCLCTWDRRRSMSSLCVSCAVLSKAMFSQISSGDALEEIQEGAITLSHLLLLSASLGCKGRRAFVLRCRVIGVHVSIRTGASVSVRCARLYSSDANLHPNLSNLIQVIASRWC